MSEDDRRYESGQPEQFIALIPGGGWMIHHSDAKRSWSEPVLAWALQANGDVVPLEADTDGMVYPVHRSDKSQSFWHPDSSSREMQSHANNHEYLKGQGGG